MTSELELPKAARDLIAHAKANGWKAGALAGEDTGGNPYVTVEIFRGEPLYVIRVTWHSRATGGRSLRLFSKIWRHVPVEGVGFYWQDAPSLKAITSKISENPVKG